MNRSQSLNVPSFFDGSNYAYWKVMMHAFLKSIDEKVWTAVDLGWSSAKCAVDGVVKVKDPSKWTANERELANWNRKGVNANFISVSLEEFMHISNCAIAKDAWDILALTHEGTKAIRNSKLQLNVSKFEEIRMKEDESFNEFYGKLTAIVNVSFSLGEKIPESKVVRKVLRSLPEWFRSKIIAIEENKNLDEIKIDKLVGSIQTYELIFTTSINDKSIALKTIKEEADSTSDDDSLEDEDMSLFVKKFKNAFRFKKGRNWKDQKGNKKSFNKSN